MNEDVDFPELLKIYRIQNGYRQAEAAQALGYSKDTIASWEYGRRYPANDEIPRLARILEVDAQALARSINAKRAEAYRLKTCGEPTVTLPAASHLLQPDQSSSVIRLTKEQATAFLSLLGGDMEHDSAKRSTLITLLKMLGGITGVALANPLQELAQIGNLFHTEEILSISAANIPVLWQLYFDGHLSEVENGLSDYLLPLSAMVEQPSIHQKRAAILASKAHQLACMIALQSQDYTSALIHADHALQYARVAEDSCLQVASLIRKALVYLYLKRPSQRLWAYQEAMQYRSNVSPLLQGRVYMGLAETHSALACLEPAHENEALQFLDLMHKTFPSHPKEDPNFNYTYFSRTTQYEGLIYLNLNQPGKAWEILAQTDKDMSTLIVPDRVELTVHQTNVLLAMDNLEQSTTYLELAVASAKALGSQLRYYQSYDIYQQMLVKWPHEQQLKELTDLFVN
ncbi:MAG TPA: helix-turn-helix transcriptional regulator [Ktedonobacteraceae bacterium]|nr:helix-turn-helix transcriptional regulator [Ktedonobacteraceae bacterium]